MLALCAYSEPEIQLLVTMDICSVKSVHTPISVCNRVFRQRDLG